MKYPRLILKQHEELSLLQILNALDYQLSLSNLSGVVTGAHIHRCSMETNGPMVATLNIGGKLAGTSTSTSAGSGSVMTSLLWVALLLLMILKVL